MLRVILKTVATGALAVSALALAAEGSPTKSTRPTANSDAAGFFTRIYGSHPECRYGEYREDGKRREGWHQHLRGQVFRCTPGSTDGPGTPQRSSPGDSGRGSYGDRGRATGNRSDGGGSSNIKRGGTSNGDRGITSGGTENKPPKTSSSFPKAQPPSKPPSKPTSKPTPKPPSKPRRRH
jgi:hypothetical protein